MHRPKKPVLALAALALTLSLAACGTSGGAAAGSASSTSSAASAESVVGQATAESNKHIMERFTREFLPKGDPALANELISPDIDMYFAGQHQKGRDTYLGIVAANSQAFPDLKWTVDDMLADGDTVAVRYTMTGTQQGAFAGVAATGKVVHAQSMAFYRLANGKIVEERAQLDMLSLLQQMGAVPGAS